MRLPSSDLAPRRAFAAALLAIPVLFAACSGSSPGVSPSDDGGPPDALAPDASNLPQKDASSYDAAADATTPDAGGADARTPPVEAGADASDGASRDAAEGGSRDGETESSTDAGLDADQPDALDASDAGPPEACSDPGPLLVIDAGPAPTRAWCAQFPFSAGTAPQLTTSGAFTPGGGVTLLGLPSYQTSGALDAAVLPTGAPFALELGPLGALTAALPLATEPPPDASTESMTNLPFAGAVATGGQLLVAGAERWGYSGSNPVSAGVLWAYDPGGAPLWSKNFSPTAFGATTTVSAVLPVAGGDVIIAGSFGGGTDFGSGPLSTSSAGDTFVARYGSTGVLGWVKPLGTAFGGGPVAAALDADGHVSVLSSDLPEGGTGFPDWILARLDAATGAIAWTVDLGAITFDGATTAVSADGDDVLLSIADPSAALRVFGYSGADGSQKYVGPPLGESMHVGGLLSDGAGGAYVVGGGAGGYFGSGILLPTDTLRCLVLHTDGTGSATAAGFCSLAAQSVATTVVRSGAMLLVAGTTGVPQPGSMFPSPVTPYAIAVEYALP